MEAWQAVLLGVVALLVGALLPVLFQLVLTLKAVRAAAEQAGPAIASIVVTAGRLERLTATIEEGGRVEQAMEAIDSLTRTVGKLQETARVAATVGAAVIPAVSAAVQAWRTSQQEAGDDGAGAATSAEEVAP